MAGDLITGQDLAECRALATGTLTGHATVERRDGVTVGPDGEEITAWRTVYDGRALTQISARQVASEVDSAGAPIRVLRYVGKAPHGTDIQPGDRWRDADGPVLAVQSVDHNDLGILTRAELALAEEVTHG